MHVPLRALLLDMDGTLTTPMLDFAAIKAEMGIGDQPILEALVGMSAAERKIAEQILLRHEAEAAAVSTLAHGCHELFHWAEQQKLRTAIITRNSRISVDAFLDRHQLRLDALVSRDDCQFKPDPAPLRLACKRLGVKPAEAIMIGDGQYDVEAGNAAGIRTIWLSLGKPRWFAAEPSMEVVDLIEAISLLMGELAGGR